jgi:hypothetical protein
MDEEFVVFAQWLIDGVVVSIGVDAALLAAVKQGGLGAAGEVKYRSRRATKYEKERFSNGSMMPSGTPT